MTVIHYTTANSSSKFRSNYIALVCTSAYNYSACLMTHTSVQRDPLPAGSSLVGFMVAYRASHVFDFTNLSVAIDTVARASSLFILYQICLALARQECFAALSPGMPQNVNMQHEAHLAPRKLFCSLSSLAARFCRQLELGGLGLAANGTAQFIHSNCISRPPLYNGHMVKS